MATRNLINREDDSRLTFKQALTELSREERFMGMVSAMNTVLIQKGVYTKEEVEAYYCQWAEAQVRRPKNQRTGW